ncbi:hypothetical protein [Amycolatopsis sp. GM8]|uniref:hypothetical protein n=1 Tax=Amycolatopsis sp. GM8 TaxID=2896530 RepID=UPI001F20BD76|nr:hypothetical protein [Amycolatopsis sp. GM8]
MSTVLEFLDEISLLVEVGTPATLQEAKKLAARMIDTASVDQLDILSRSLDTLANHRPALAQAKLRAQWDTGDAVTRDLITFCMAEADPQQYNPDHCAAESASDVLDRGCRRLARLQDSGRLTTADEWRLELWKLDKDTAKVDTVNVEAFGLIGRLDPDDEDAPRREQKKNPRDLRVDAPTALQRESARSLRERVDPIQRREPRPAQVEPKVVTVYMATRFIWNPFDVRIPHECDDAEGYANDYEKMYSDHPILSTPCVSCWIERPARHIWTARAANTHDDGLCDVCRAEGYVGITPELINGAIATIRRSLPVRANRSDADLVAPCEVIATQHAPATALRFARYYWHHHPKRRTPVTEWVTAHFGHTVTTTDPAPVDPYAAARKAALERSAQRRDDSRRARRAADRADLRRCAEILDRHTNNHPAAREPIAA